LQGLIRQVDPGVLKYFLQVCLPKSARLRNNRSIQTARLFTVLSLHVIKINVKIYTSFSFPVIVFILYICSQFEEYKGRVKRKDRKECKRERKKEERGKIIGNRSIDLGNNAVKLGGFPTFRSKISPPSS
jgi:hypothetical protein